MTLGFLEAALRRALGDPELRVTGQRPVSGGCIHEAACLLTSAGEFFAKWSAGCAEDLFIREAECLDALRATGSGIVVPRVIAAATPGSKPGFLILEFLPPAPRSDPRDDERLGRGLAAIHGRRAPSFGFPSPTYCGPTRQDNRPAATWPSFYRERRLVPLVAALEERGELTTADRSLYEQLGERLADLLAHETVPSLIHGDLWSGNVLATTHGPALVDPACAYADREMEFGITTLFGGLSTRAMAAYEEAWPLPQGWRERNGLCQLYHLLNHALLFGGHYAGEARRTARRYL